MILIFIFITFLHDDLNFFDFKSHFKGFFPTLLSSIIQYWPKGGDAQQLEM